MSCGKYFFALLLLLPQVGQAQEKELANINYAVSGLKYNDTIAHSRQLDIKLRMPLYQKHKSTIGATLGYKNVNLNHFPDSYTPALHGILFQGAWMYKITPRRSLTLFAQAGLFSDTKDISESDFRYSAGFRYRLKHSDKLSTGWGLAYSRQFFGNQVVPFIDVDYRPNEKWSITGQFPVKPTRSAGICGLKSLCVAPPAKISKEYGGAGSNTFEQDKAKFFITFRLWSIYKIV